MKNSKTITILVGLISLVSILMTSYGIFSTGGNGSYLYESIRGNSIVIYGKGIYQHMSADVAIQGIAQDYVTMFIAIPLMLISLIGYRKNSMRSYFLLAGTIGYFLVTYLFYTAMGMYSSIFLGYVLLMGLSFFTLITLLLSKDQSMISDSFKPVAPVVFAGSFLIFTSITIALLWLSIIVPPLIDGSIYPVSVEHYTTLIVQGFDLGLLLPISFISGLLLIRRKPMGYLIAPIYFVFLSLLMTALTAKIVAMAMHEVNVIPAVFIIPTFNIVTVIFSYLLIKNVKSESRVFEVKVLVK